MFIFICSFLYEYLYFLFIFIFLLIFSESEKEEEEKIEGIIEKNVKKSGETEMETELGHYY